MYKKTREQFMEQLRAIRKQLQTKINNEPEQSSSTSRIMPFRQKLTSLQYQMPDINEPITPRQKVFHLKYDIPTSSSRIARGTSQSARRSSQQNEQLISYENIEQKLKQYEKLVKVKKKQQKQKLSTKSNGAIRLKSLPSKSVVRARPTRASQQASFQPYFQQIPANREKRAQSQLREVFLFLYEQNALFEKIDPYLSLCLLKIGYFHELFPGDVFYGTNYQRHSIFVVLYGVIALINSNIGLKKLLFTGQTFGQQMLFGSAPTRTLLQQSRSIAKSYILQIKISDYIILTEQSKKLGYLKQLTKLQDILRDSFTQKNIIRNQHILQSRMRRVSP